MANLQHNAATSHKGLNTAQVTENRSKYGSNILTPAEREPWWRLLLEKFDDPIIRILMIAAFIAIGVGFINGEHFEGIGIVIAILLATTLAFLNEYKAAKEFDILNQVSDEAPIKVIRDGAFTTVPIKDLVYGDIVLLEAGDEVPADGRVLEAVSLQIDEARLTGESMPVTKRVLTGEESSDSEDNAYPPDFVLRSTMVYDGHGVIEVTAVGDATEIGKAAKAASEDSDEPTPLNRQLDRLSKLIGVVGFSIAFLTFIALVFRDYRSGDLILSAEQWGFSLILFISAVIGLAKVWMPILADGFELAGRELRLPKIIEAGGLKAWLKVAVAGLLFFVLCTITGVLSGFLPENPSGWLTAMAVSDFLKFFMIAVTIIVVAVPEGLPMSVTLSLAYSMRKMTAANNLVRRMHACETIGAATVICSDKTGTLTQNRMVMNAVFFPALTSGVLKPGLATSVEKIVAESMAANSTANLSRKDEKVTGVLGNPTEGATLMWLEEQGVDYLQLRQDFALEMQWTFSTERKMMGSYGLSGAGGEKILYVKGAPELILSRCSEILTDKGLQAINHFSEKIALELKQSQARGMRTLGFAFRRGIEHKPVGDIDGVARNLVWLGFVAIADPIRPEVPLALNLCRRAGVKVKIITGDNSNTAWEIARQAGLVEPGENAEKIHMTGSDFQALSDSEAAARALDIKILSRARPADKLKMVRLLQQSGEVVAVTGDGTNDAPALNHANVGLAMGKTGTSVAKEASDIILLDDSFPSVVKGIMWGRSLYDNIQRFIMFQLTINVVALAVALTGPFIGIKMPLTVVQMLWVNLIMDTFAALALATEPPHWKVMARLPRRSEDFIVSAPMYRHILGVGALFYLFLIAFLKYFQSDGAVDVKELSVFFTTFVMLQVWNMFNARALGFSHSAFRRLGENHGFIVILPAIVIVQFLIVQYGSTMFRTEPLSLATWMIIIAGTSIVLWAGELWRKIFNTTRHGEIEDLSPFEELTDK
ncbi:MAG: calcium-translocating P-type ATPase, PMCA-type [Candidatus Riflebacteria bacterium]|nr:calcium-translocating P-type ATPase, PMCA-type [Candidatus Riflebacteria bacterium]